MFTFFHNVTNENEQENSQGLAAEDLAQLQSQAFQADNSVANQPCVICLENIEVGARVIKLNCNHTFHSSCVAQWFGVNTTCPICRSNESTTENNADDSNGNTTVRLPLENFMHLYTTLQIVFVFPNRMRCTTTWHIYNRLTEVFQYVERTCGNINNLTLYFGNKIFKTTESYSYLNQTLYDLGIFGNQTVEISTF